MILVVARDENSEVASCGPSVKNSVAPINAFNLIHLASVNSQAAVLVPGPNFIFASFVLGRENLIRLIRCESTFCGNRVQSFKPRSSDLSFSSTSKIGRRGESV